MIGAARWCLYVGAKFELKKSITPATAPVPTRNRQAQWSVNNDGRDKCGDHYDWQH